MKSACPLHCLRKRCKPPNRLRRLKPQAPKRRLVHQSSQGGMPHYPTVCCESQQDSPSTQVPMWAGGGSAVAPMCTQQELKHSGQQLLKVQIQQSAISRSAKRSYKRACRRALLRGQTTYKGKLLSRATAWTTSPSPCSHRWPSRFLSECWGTGRRLV